MIQLLYHPKGWNLQPPKLIISVTGGAQKFTLPAATRKAFKRGLAKAAASTGSWIITGGTEYGVMRLVGEAVAEEPSKYGRDIVVLGIATWGKIALRDRMVLGPKVTLNLFMANVNKLLFYKSIESQILRESASIVRLFIRSKIPLQI